MPHVSLLSFVSTLSFNQVGDSFKTDIIPFIRRFFYYWNMLKSDKNINHYDWIGIEIGIGDPK